LRDRAEGQARGRFGLAGAPKIAIYGGREACALD
jgi:hypothetical protein